jgi:hypothetical protein
MNNEIKIGERVVISDTLDPKTKRAHLNVIGLVGELIKYYEDGDAMVNFGGYNVWSVDASILREAP